MDVTGTIVIFGGEEAIANTLTHGHRGVPGEFRVSIRASREATEVRIEDCASPFDTLPFTVPDCESGLGGRRIGAPGAIPAVRVVAAHPRGPGHVGVGEG